VVPILLLIPGAFPHVLKGLPWIPVRFALALLPGVEGGTYWQDCSMREDHFDQAIVDWTVPIDTKPIVLDSCSSYHEFRVAWARCLAQINRCDNARERIFAYHSHLAN
jgi:hypothetical protein